MKTGEEGEKKEYIYMTSVINVTCNKLFLCTSIVLLCRIFQSILKGMRWWNNRVFLQTASGRPVEPTEAVIYCVWVLMNQIVLDIHTLGWFCGGLINVTESE